MDNLAGNGISLWFWKSDIAPARTEVALTHGRARLASDDAIYGWKNAVVACDNDGCTLGVVISYQLPEPDEDIQDLKQTAPAFVPVFDLFGLAVGNWLVDCLSVYPQAQGLGIGRTLLEDSLKRARKEHLGEASLVVEDSNETAIKLYRGAGFEVTDQRDFIEFDGPSKTKKWLLMTAKI